MKCRSGVQSTGAVCSIQGSPCARPAALCHHKQPSSRSRLAPPARGPTAAPSCQSSRCCRLLQSPWDPGGPAAPTARRRPAAARRRRQHCGVAAGPPAAAAHRRQRRRPCRAAAAAQGLAAALALLQGVRHRVDGRYRSPQRGWGHQMAGTWGPANEHKSALAHSLKKRWGRLQARMRNWAQCEESEQVHAADAAQEAPEAGPPLPLRPLRLPTVGRLSRPVFLVWLACNYTSG